MHFIRHNWIGILVVAAIAIGFFLDRTDWEEQRDLLRKDGIASCIRENQRSALVVSFQRDVAQSRRENKLRGSKEAADRYDAYAVGMLQRLALPSPTTNPERMAQVQLVMHGRQRAFILTPEARSLIHLGCSRAYHDSLRSQ